jgi:AAA family ATP:ADP antiporter
MSFNNTILDSLGNSLVITAAGGGAQVIPFLTVYAVWPLSFAFLLAYSAATQRLTRAALFNVVLGGFLAACALFGFAYPHRDALHLAAPAAAAAAAALPAGLAGGVGMVRNWTFTLFYCGAELWGDVVLSLLFWGLANETTSIEEAPLLYPLFGLGANVGQAVSGRALSVFHRCTDGLLTPSAQVQALMATVVLAGCIVLALHAHIVRRWPATRVAAPVAAAGAPAPPAQPTLREAFSYLAQSPQIRCLAVMALAQGLAGNLLEIAWKAQVHLLFPSPSAYAAVMGDVAMWTGVVTGSLMLLSPTLFRLWRWHGVASATPRFMMAAGLPFFAGSALFARAYPGGGAATPALQALAVSGALLLVFAKGAKFSMFKPAEEMVYIGLDDQSRTKGKAAIDVAGAQTGKSAGSVLQQVLLVAASGSAAAALPAMAAAYWAILAAWKRAVDTLDALHVVAFDDGGDAGVGDLPADAEDEASDGGETARAAAAAAA